MKAERQKRIPVAAALVALALASVGCDRVRARFTVRQGNDFFKAQKYEKALELYEEALQEDESLLKLHRNMGLAYMAMFQPASKSPKDVEIANKAIEHFLKYIEAFPQDPKGGDYLVNMYMAANRLDDAEKYYKAKESSNPNDLDMMRRLAIVYQKKGNFDESLKYRQKEIQLLTEPEAKATAYYTIGVFCWDRSYNYPDLDPAYRESIIKLGLDSLDQATKLKKDYVEAISYQNLLYREKAKHELDEVKKAEWIAIADKYRGEAMALMRARKAAAAQSAAGTAASAAAH